MSKAGYTKLQNEIGIYQNKKSLHYLVIKKFSGKNYQKTFKSLSQAKAWRRTIQKYASMDILKVSTTTLKKVWLSMQTQHFLNLAPNTCAIWIRRYRLLKALEDLPMRELTPTIVTTWVNENVQFFKLNSERMGKGNTGNKVSSNHSQINASK